MLRKLKLHNFRTFLNAEIEFRQRHLLIGPNNSGKTNLLNAIRFLGATASIDLAKASVWIPGGALEIRNWRLDRETVALSCECDIEFDGAPTSFTYELELRPRSSQGAVGAVELRVVAEKLTVAEPGGREFSLIESDGETVAVFDEDRGTPTRTEFIDEAGAQQATMLSKLYEVRAYRRALSFRRHLSAWWYYRFDPDAMRAGSDARVFPTVLDPRGQNLANFIYGLKNVDEVRYRRVIEHARLVEPELVAINFLPLGDRTPLPFVSLKSKTHALWSGLSDGTLRVLALACLIELGNAGGGQIAAQPLHMVEEPENGIWPGVLRKVFDLVEEHAPDSQFIFTSHSPYFIDLFDAEREAVTILRRRDERTEILGAPHVRPEDQTPDRLTLAETYALELTH